MEFIIDENITKRENDPLYAHMSKEQIIQMDYEIEKSKMYVNYGQNDDDWSKPEDFTHRELSKVNKEVMAQKPRDPIQMYDVPLIHDKINVTKTLSPEEIEQSPFLRERKSSFLHERRKPFSDKESVVQDFDHNGEPKSHIIDKFKPLVLDYLGILKALEREARNLAVKSIWKYVYDKQYRQQHQELIKSCFDQVLKNLGEPNTVVLKQKNFKKFLNLYFKQKGQYCGSSISLPVKQQDNWYVQINELKDTNGISVEDFIQFQTIVKCTADTFSEETEFWKNFRLWSEKNVTYSQVCIQPYSFDIFDLHKFPHYLKNGWPFCHQQITAPLTSKKLDVQILSHYQEGDTRSQRYLRVVQRQVMKSIRTKEEVEAHIMKFYLFDEEKQEFELQFDSVYDISKGILDSTTNSFTNQFFLTRQNYTYYFKKERKKEGNEDKEGKQGFQMYRHAMSEGRFYKGIQPKLEPEGQMKYNLFINVEPILKQYNLKLEDLAIMFLQNVNIQYNLKGETDYLINFFEDSFLKNQFVCIYKKIYEKSKLAYTFAKIYFLRLAKKKLKGIYELEEPILDIKSEINKLQTGFVWGQNPIGTALLRNGDKMNFTLKGQKITYNAEYEYAEPETEEQDKQEGTGNLQTRIMKERHKVPCQKFAEHMYKINYRKILLEFSSAEVDLMYYHSYDAYNIQLINPILELTNNYMAPGVNNQQEEAAYVLAKIWNYKRREGAMQSVVYEDYYFTFCDTPEFRTSALYHIDDLDDGRDFDRFDVYFSNKDIIIKTNFRSNKIHVWHTNPNYIDATLIDKLRKVQSQNLFYQHNILSRFDRRNADLQNYQNNYPYDREEFEAIRTNDVYQLEPVYIHKQKKNITTAHNFISINEKTYRCDENLLLIDLNDYEKEGQMSLIRLIHSDLKDMGIRLLHYFVCYSKYPQQAFFFFQQRNLKKDGNKFAHDIRVTGVHFFVQKTLEELHELATDLKQNGSKAKKALVTEGQTEITILESVKEAYQIKYHSQEVISKQDNTVLFQRTNSDLRFDFVQDMAQNKSDFIIPFYFCSHRSYSDRRKKFFDSYYENYIAFLDMTKFEWKKGNEKMNYPTKYITFIKHRNFKYIHENEYKIENAVKQKNDRSNYIFLQRVSPWKTKGVNPWGLEDKTRISQISAKFQIGTIFDFKVKLREFQEILVTIDAENDNKISIKYLGLIWSQHTETDLSIVSLNLQYERIVPKVDNNGVFHGSIDVVPHSGYYRKPVRIKTYEEGYKFELQRMAQLKIQHPQDQANPSWEEKFHMLAGQHVEIVECCRPDFKKLRIQTYKNAGLYISRNVIADLEYDHSQNPERYNQPLEYKYNFTKFPDDYNSDNKSELKLLLTTDKQINECCSFQFVRYEKGRYLIKTKSDEYVTLKKSEKKKELYLQPIPEKAKLFIPERLKGGKWTLKTSSGYLEGNELVQKKDSSIDYSNIFEIEIYKPEWKPIHDLKSFLDFMNRKQASYYVMELNDDREQYDPHVLLQTPFTQLSCKKFVVNGKYKEQMITVLQARLLKQVIFENIFDANHQLQELYKANSSLLCMGMNNFFEMFKMAGDLQEQRLKHYFQPKLLYNGRSQCSLEFTQLSKRLRPLKQAINIYSEENSLINVTVQNSMCTERVKIDIPDDEKNQIEAVQEFFNLFGINVFQSFEFDLNHKSMIYEGLIKNYNRPVRMIIETIQKLDDGHYQELLIQELPEILSQEQIRIDEFLTKSLVDEKDDDLDSIERTENCNLETKLRDNQLPLLCSENTNYFEQESFKNIFDLKEELVEKIKQDKIYEKQGNSMIWIPFSGEDDPSDVLVDYNIMNFLPMIRKTKIALFLGWGQEDIPANQYMHKVRQQFAQHPEDYNKISNTILADLILRQSDSKEFFECSSVIKIIQQQYEMTVEIYWFLLKIYFMTFILPFGFSLVFYNRYDSDDHTANYTRIFLTVICATSNISFWLLEFIEIHYMARTKELTWDFDIITNEYFTGWNVTDFLQPFIYLTHATLWFSFDLQQAPTARFLYWIFTVFGLSFSFDKMMQYMRYHDKFSFLVSMFYMVFKDLRAFLFLMGMMIFFFSFVITVMGGEVDAGDYAGLPTIVALIIQMWRNSIGDLAMIQAGKMAIDYENETPNFAQISTVVIIWGIWAFDILIMVIVILNFLIAEVSQTYEKVMTSGQQFLYKNKADCNLLSQLYEEYYNRYVLRQKPGKQIGFQAILFRDASNIETQDGGENFGFTNTVKKDNITLLNKQKNEIVSFIKQVDDQIRNTKNASISMLEQTVKNIIKLQDNTFEGLTIYMEEQFEKIDKKTDGFMEKVSEVKTAFEQIEESKKLMEEIKKHIEIFKITKTYLKEQ